MSRADIFGGTLSVAQSHAEGKAQAPNGAGKCSDGLVSATACHDSSLSPFADRRSRPYGRGVPERIFNYNRPLKSTLAQAHESIKSEARAEAESYVRDADAEQWAARLAEKHAAKTSGRDRGAHRC
jgi:hypothetical protein